MCWPPAQYLEYERGLGKLDERSMKLYKAKESDREKWNEFVAVNNGSFMQSWQWGEFKHGDTHVMRVVAKSEDGMEWLGVAQLYRRPLRRGKFYYYLPRGPVVKGGDYEVALEFLKRLPEAAHKRRAVFLRIDPAMMEDAGMRDALVGHGYRDLKDQVEPKHTVYIDLSQNDEEILGSMKYRARRKIKRGNKDGLQFRVVHCNDDDFDERFDEYWKLVEKTSSRKAISFYSKAYYAGLFAAMREHATMHLVYDGDQVLVANVIICFGQYATYLFGASDEDAGGHGASYYAQYEGMLWAKHQGMNWLDLWGVSKDGWPAKWNGITFFKESFGGQRVSFVGAYDFVYSGVWYKLYSMLRKNKTHA